MKINAMAAVKSVSLVVFLGLLISFVSPVYATPTWQEDRITVHHSLDKAEAALIECKDYVHLFEDVTKSRKVSKNQCYIEAQIPGALLWMKLIVEPPRVDADGHAVRINARMLDGNIKAFRAHIKLTYLGERKTMITMRIQADPGLPGVLDSQVEAKTRKMIYSALVKLNTRLLLGKY